MRKFTRCIAVLIVAFLLNCFVQTEAAAAENKETHPPAACKTVFECLDTKAGKEDQLKQQQETKAESSASGGSGVVTFIKVLFSLGLVLFLLFFLLKMIQKRTKNYQEGKALQSLGGLNVGSNRSVQMIKAGSSVLVIGVGETVTLLKEINEEEEVKLLLSSSQQETGNRLKQTSGFSDVFKAQLRELSGERGDLLKRLLRKGKADD
ncbi:flagellar protein FliO/FliZ [Fictibacillus solisalsi]|uniref:Flagellar protein FliO/FliZ n=1 Tax=Fictibacillus solisalsi TaxID=459525 RepID=A0A1G9UYB6_9BACL|nr:flagellar biosynthetic protein FliO [Fictibacillus solisalsi]SDM64800.1 flagellar protein FliO/FliZ [Fictibacillus solisalsi]